MMDANRYNVSIKQEVVEGEICYEARVQELPDVVEYADTPEAAYALALDSIETTAQVLKAKGRVMPPPHVHDSAYSGRITLRMPVSIHRHMAISAQNEATSLNQYIVNMLCVLTGGDIAAKYLPPARTGWYAVDDLSTPKARARAGVVRSISLGANDDSYQEIGSTLYQLSASAGPC